MSYETCVDALLITLKGVQALSGRASVIGDRGLLNAGLQQAAVIEYDSFRQELNDYGEHRLDWRFDITVFVRQQSNRQVRKDLGVLRQAVLDQLNQHPRLGQDANTIFTSL